MPASKFSRVLFAIGPTGPYCREDRCQSYFQFELIPSMRPPLEECQGAAGVRSAGGVAAVIDAPAEKISEQTFFRRIREFNPDLLSLAVTFGSLEDDLALAQRIKAEFPELVIALRGAPCYVFAHDILNRCDGVDLCTRGDYELVFEQLSAQGFNAQGIIYRDQSGVIRESSVPRAANLDDLPMQDRSSIRQELYTVRGSRNPQATIHVQRGCPFPCTFCLVHTVTGNRARHRSPESVVQEVKKLQLQGISHFYLRAETFTLDKRWTVAVSEALAQYCPGAKWVTATRVECVDEEILSAMRRGGCYGISFGVDVASETIGKKVRKPPRLADAVQAMRLCDQVGIVALAYIMIGFLWDTPETIREAREFIYKIRPDLLTVHFAHPYPGTPYFEAVRQSGQEITSLRAQSNPAHSLSGLSSTQLNRFARAMLLQHYARPAVWASLARKSLFRRRSSLPAVTLQAAESA